MATATYEPIQTQTLSSATNVVTFSSIPQTYTDLVLIVNGRKDTSVTSDAIYCRINGDGNNNYSFTDSTANNSISSSSRTSNDAYCRLAVVAGNNSGTSTLGVAICNFQDYANSTTYKTVVSRGSVSGGESMVGISLWRNTAAITSFTLYTAGLGNWASDSKFTLYGIKAGS